MATYAEPTVPEVLLLDTRTHRALTNDGPPGLLNAAARRWIERQRRDLPGPGYEPLLVVSPPPVVGNTTLEGAQGAVASFSRYGSRVPTRFSDSIGRQRYGLDAEAWCLNEENLAAMLRTLKPLLRKVIFVSGDVHYGFTAMGTWSERSFDSAPLRFVQMTGSSMRNATEGGAASFLFLTGLNTFPVHHGTISYRFVGPAAFVTENNLSHATVDWVGVDDVRVTHTIITPGGERVDVVDF